jgi:HSP20 family protein
MSLMRWDPFRERLSLRNAMDRLFEESFMRPRWLMGWPGELSDIPLDIYTEGDNLIVKASVPGIKPEELNVQVRDDMLTISGQMKQETERKDDDYHLRERRYGRFERTVALPHSVTADKAQAEFDNGVLTLTLPRAAEEPRNKKIPVKVRK